MEINISYYLDEHGWSTCWVYVNGRFYEISITHVFPENPIEVCLDALIGIIKGERERKFVWYGEPGGEQITINEVSRTKHMVNVKLENFSEDYGDETKDLEVTMEFEIKKKQLIRLLYYEFKKISKLMEDKEYEENRKKEFPFQKFKIFENIVSDFIGIG